MATTIVTKSGSGAPTASDLVAGELAVDLTNKRLYTEDSGGTVLEVGSNPYNFTANHDGSAKLATTATGIDVTGTVTSGDITIAVDDTPTLNFKKASSADILGTINVTTDAGSGGKMVFQTKRNGDTALDRMTIDDGGNVGIGTSSPATQLHVADASDSNAQIRINGSTSTVYSRLYSDNNGVLAISTDVGNQVAGSYMMFEVKGTERMRIDASGNVNINGTDNRPLAITSFATASAGAGWDLDATSSNGVVTVSTGGTEAMRIDASGNVGIGTSSPTDYGSTANTLEVKGASGSGIGALQLQGADSVVKALLYAGGSTEFIINTQSNHNMGFNTNNTRAMTIESNGNVGLGTSLPGVKLDVRGEVAVAYNASYGLRFYNEDRTNWGSIGSGIATGSTAADLVFKTGIGEAMRIDTSGNLLVGRTSDGATGNGHSIRGGNSAIFSRDSSGESMIIARNASAGDLVRFYCNNLDKGSIDFDGSNTISYTSSSDQRLKENIADADDAGSKIDAIQVRKFDWKADGAHQDYGMVAQELQVVAPEAVSGDSESDEMMGVDYSKLVPMMLKEIQSLRARIAALES